MIIIEKSSEVKQVPGHEGILGTRETMVHLKGEYLDEAMAALLHATDQTAKKFIAQHPSECSDCPAMLFAKNIIMHCKQIEEETLTSLMGNKS